MGVIFRYVAVGEVTTVQSHATKGTHHTVQFGLYRKHCGEETMLQSSNPLLPGVAKKLVFIL